MKPVRVVVTGVGVICPLGRDTEEFWANLVAGKSAVRPAARPDFAGIKDAYVGEVPDDWLGLERRAGGGQYERNTMLALHAVDEALGRSGLDARTLAAAEVGVVVGKCQGTPGLEPGTYLPFQEACDNVANHFGLTGPRVVISTACAAGGNAVGVGCDLLWNRSADVVVAGGVDTLMRETHLGFAGLLALSPGPTAPYSRSDGLSLGEGAAFTVLETFEHAQARNAAILAEVAGYGLSADAYHATAPDPSGRGAVAAVRRALTDAGLSATDISYVNGHGTGTPSNDKMERRAMRSLFGDQAGRVPISSTKSAIGHTLGAAGAIEAVACIQALVTGIVPPTVNFGEPEGCEEMDFVPNRGRPAKVEVAVSNSYAFGGNNCSLVLSRPARRTARRVPRRRRVLISGLGAVGNPGYGLDDWRKVLAEGACPIPRLSTFDGSRYGCEYGVEPTPLDGRRLAPASLWRHMDEFGRQSLAAAALAWRDAGFGAARTGRDDVGLVFATGYGPIRTAAGLEAQEGRDEALSAVSFANAVVSAAPGAVCQALSFRGPATAVAGGGACALAALDIALSLINERRADRLVLLATDDLCETVLRERAKREPLAADGVIRPYGESCAGTVLGAASVALVLEAEESVAQRNGRAYCEVAGVAHRGSAGGYSIGAGGPVRAVAAAGAAGPAVPTPAVTTMERTLRGLLGRTGYAPDDIDYCAGFGSGSLHDLVELHALARVFPSSLALSAPKSLTGECEAASGAVNLLVAALAVAEGLVPATANLGTPLPDATLRHITAPGTRMEVRGALANACTPLSTYASALLRPA